MDQHTEADGRRIVQTKDLAAAIYKTDMYDFLEEVIPRDQLKEHILKATNSRQHVGSSTISTNPHNNVPQQHEVGVSIGTSVGGHQPPPFMPLYQSGPHNQHSFLPGPQTLYQQIHQQPFMLWSPAQQQPFMPWPLPHYQQQPFISWQHTPEQQMYNALASG